MREHVGWHPISHKIRPDRWKESVLDEPFHEPGNVTRVYPDTKVSSSSYDTRFIATTFGASAKLLGEGVYGAAFVVKEYDDIKALYARVTHKIGSMPRRTSNLEFVVKLSVDAFNDGEKAFVANSIRESAAHLAAHRGAPDVVPAFYFGGMVRGVYVNVSHRAPGVTLHSYLSSHAQHMPSSLYTAIKRAILKLWSLGIVHGDMHGANILVDPHTKRVSIIDFGLALKLPTSIRTAIAPFLRAGDAQGAWRIMEPFVDALTAQRHPEASWSNPNGKALLVWQRMVSSTLTDEDESSGSHMSLDSSRSFDKTHLRDRSLSHSSSTGRPKVSFMNLWSKHA